MRAEKAEKEAAEEEERVCLAERRVRIEMKKQALVDLKGADHVPGVESAGRPHAQVGGPQDGRVQRHPGAAEQPRRVLARPPPLPGAGPHSEAVPERRARNQRHVVAGPVLAAVSHLLRPIPPHPAGVPRVARQGARGRPGLRDLAEKNQEWYKAGEDFRANPRAMRRELERLQKRRARN